MSEDVAGRNEETENARPDPVEEAGETTAASLIVGAPDARPVGEGTKVVVEGDDEPGRVQRDE